MLQTEPNLLYAPTHRRVAALCFCLLRVCRRAFPSCLSLRLFTPSFVFPSLAEPVSAAFLISASSRLFPSSSLLASRRAAAGRAVTQRGPRGDPDEREPALVENSFLLWATRDQRWLVKDAMHQFDWIWRMFFDLIDLILLLLFLFCFFALRLHARLLLPHVVLPGKSQFLFDMTCEARQEEWEV